MSSCPSCGIEPLVVEQQKGIFRFKCCRCKVELVPDCEALIDILPDVKTPDTEQK